jgi:hypothetical protein
LGIIEYSLGEFNRRRNLFPLYGACDYNHISILEIPEDMLGPTIVIELLHLWVIIGKPSFRDSHRAYSYFIADMAEIQFA